jgi:hypothetical protein
VQSPAANTPGTEVWPRRVDFDLAARRELDHALEPIGVRHESDLHEYPGELEPMRPPPDARSL